MTSDKIRPLHLERNAILYVRQSSAHHVLHNRESSALQYAMRDCLVVLGWSQIETIDDDLGCCDRDRSAWRLFGIARTRWIKALWGGLLKRYETALCPTILDHHVLALDVAVFVQPLPECSTD
jgi:hypothetical protein